MGFWRRVFSSGSNESTSRSERKLTPDEMAVTVYETAVQLAFEGENSLDSLLQEAGITKKNRPQYQAELIISQLFLLDLTLNRVFGKEAVPVRMKMREVFADRAIEAAESAGHQPSTREEYVALVTKRFKEYAPALRKSMEHKGSFSEEAMRFPGAVCSNVGRGSNTSLQAQMAVTMQWASVLSQYTEAFQRVSISQDS